MAATSSTTSLRDYEIGISGAIPELHAWSEPAMDLGILEFIAVFCGLVFKHGGRIVHGSHPTFTPVILRQARLHACDRDRAPVTLVMSELWASSLSTDEERSLTDIAELIVTRKIGDSGPEDTTTRNRSLSAMRRVLVCAQNVMVAVGGKMHEADGKKPGVGEEMSLAAAKGIPQFLVGGLGGYSMRLASKLLPAELRNHLSHEENAALFGTADVAACVGILFQHFCSSAELGATLRRPDAIGEDTSSHIVRVVNDWRPAR